MSSNWSSRDEDEDEEEDELDLKSFDDHIIFLIDVRRDMLRQNSKGEVVLINVLKLLLSVLKLKIVESDKSCVGAVCFGAVSGHIQSPFLYFLTTYCMCMHPSLHPCRSDLVWPL